MVKAGPAAHALFFIPCMRVLPRKDYFTCGTAKVQTILRFAKAGFWLRSSHNPLGTTCWLPDRKQKHSAMLWNSTGIWCFETKRNTGNQPVPVGMKMAYVKSRTALLTSANVKPTPRKRVSKQNLRYSVKNANTDVSSMFVAKPLHASEMLFIYFADFQALLNIC